MRQQPRIQTGSVQSEILNAETLLFVILTELRQAFCAARQKGHGMKKLMENIKKYCPQSVRSWMIFFITILCASVLCRILQGFTVKGDYRSDVHVPMIFVLATLIISILTDGYFYGLLSAVVSVFAVNWAFTYPYMKLDFSIFGYPLTFITMLGVGFAASTMASGQRERERLRRETEKEKMRANLLRSVSHDLRTPLTAISGSVSAVLEDGSMLTEAEKTELLENARRDADWLTRMVENLLSITKINSTGMEKLNMNDELPEEVISEAVQKFKNRNPEIAVSVFYPAVAEFIPMDAMLIEQVLLNLMDNAVIHGKNTTVINISAQSEEKVLRIRVADNGRGINERQVRRLLDGSEGFPMEQASDKSRFMGIGLAVCKTIVGAHGGEITAANRPEGGAEFAFTIRKGEHDEYPG